MLEKLFRRSSPSFKQVFFGKDQKTLTQVKIITKHVSNRPVMFATYKCFAVLFFLPSCCVSSLIRRQMVSTMLACAADEQMPKSLFWAPSCVPGCEYAPWLACKMSHWRDILGMLTDLWILWGPGTTEDIGAANFLFVNGRCHLENFWPVIESDSIKKKEDHNRPESNPGANPVLSYALIYHFPPYHYTTSPT